MQLICGSLVQNLLLLHVDEETVRDAKAGQIFSRIMLVNDSYATALVPTLWVALDKTLLRQAAEASSAEATRDSSARRDLYGLILLLVWVASFLAAYNSDTQYARGKDHVGTRELDSTSCERLLLFQMAAQGGRCLQEGCGRELADTPLEEFARQEKVGQRDCLSVSTLFARDEHIALSRVWILSTGLPANVALYLLASCPSIVLSQWCCSDLASPCYPSVVKLEHYYGCKLSRDRHLPLVIPE